MEADEALIAVNPVFPEKSRPSTSPEVTALTEQNPGRVLVPDADTRAALAAIRSLGRHGCTVHVGTKPGGCLGSRSRHAREVIEHADPATEPARFAGEIAEAAERERIGAILPAADIPANALIAYRNLLPEGTKLLVPPVDELALAHDKIRLAELASSIGVSVPRGHVITKPDELERATRELGFPSIVKPRFSRCLVEGSWRGFGVRRVGDHGELRRLVDEDPGLLSVGFLLQEIVPGEGRGVFLLAREGRVVCSFAHRRIREKPPSGGVSTLCEAERPEPGLLEDATRLLEAMRWNGVAMVEFKWDPATRRRWLMEINGRLWGSLQLAISSGADFPWLLYRQEVLGENLEPFESLLEVRLWWMLGDLDHFVLRLREDGLSKLPVALGDLARTRQGRRLVIDTFSIHDPGPFLFELSTWLRDVFRRRA